MSKPKGVGRYERIDITGERYGRLVAIEYVGRDKKNKSLSIWKCKCDCGNEITVPISRLRSGNTKSCGCYKKDKQTKHGMTKTKLYRVWCQMRNRCNTPNSCNYFRYGARGIKICDEWQGNDGFQNFYKWAKDNGYKDGLWIERIDNDGDYKPSNCRWATIQEQCRNKRTTKLLTVKGESHIAKDWSRISGISANTISSRINNGWDIESAIYAPIGYRFKRYGKYETTHD